MISLTYQDLHANFNADGIRTQQNIALMVDWFSQSRQAKHMFGRVYQDSRNSVLLDKCRADRGAFERLGKTSNLMPFFMEFIEGNDDDIVARSERAVKEILYFMSSYSDEGHITDWLSAQFGGDGGVMPINNAIEYCPDEEQRKNLIHLKELGLKQVSEVSVFGEEYTEVMLLLTYEKLKEMLDKPTIEEEE